MKSEQNLNTDKCYGRVRQLTEEEKMEQRLEGKRRYLQDIATYESQIQQIKKQFEECSQELDARMRQYKERKRELEVIEQEIEILEQKIEEKLAIADWNITTRTKIEDALKEKNAENNQLKAKIEQLKKRIVELESKSSN